MSDYNRGGSARRPSGPNRPRPTAPRTGRPTVSYGEPAPARRAKPAPAPAKKKGPQYQIGGTLPKGFGLLAGVCAAIIVAGVALQLAMPDGFVLKSSKAKPAGVQMITEIHSRGPLRINEIMASNSGVITDSEGNAPDWLEVINVGNAPVDIGGYVLAHKAKAGNVFVFPDMTLQPNECAIVFADGKLQADSGSELHAPFRLSASGDKMMLFNPSYVAVDTVNIPALAQNTVYRRVDADTWQVSNEPTPGLANTAESYKRLTTVTGQSDVRIAELMSDSASCAPDENGVCHDYVILTTASGSGADLSGWYLSDDAAFACKWRFPDGAAIPAGGRLLVHCSGLDRKDDPAHLHTDFKLSSEGEQLMLSDASGRPVDLVTFDLLKTDVALLRGEDGSWTVGTSTAADN